MRVHRKTRILAAAAASGLLLTAVAVISTAGRGATRIRVAASNATAGVATSVSTIPAIDIRQVEAQLAHPTTANSAAGAPPATMARVVDNAKTDENTTPTHPSSTSTTTTEVRASYVTGDAAVCDPQSVAPHNGDPTKVDVSCETSSTYIGGLDGQTHAHLTATIDALSGDITGGVFNEWFYGTYSGEDGSLGAIDYAGTFFIDGKTNTFSASATILSATCSFAGSTGTLKFDGMELVGGLVVRLTRPDPAPAFSPTCNPVSLEVA